MRLHKYGIGLFVLSFLGISSLVAQSPVDNVSSHRLSLKVSGNRLKLPYYRNFSLGSENENVTRAVVVIHGTGRNADDYYNRILEPARSVRKAGETIIIAPQFLIEEDIVAHNLPGDVLFWSNSGWKQGDKSKDTNEHPRPARISAFAVVDTILSRLAQNNVNLDIIVVAGHSAGGQFVNRYAAGNAMESVLEDNYGIHVRYIVANPSSYLYFDNERRVGGTLDQFTVPNTRCFEYDDYKYGLSDLNSYMGAVGAAKIKAQYSQRDVVYLLGADDNDPNASSLDKTCPAMLQGNHRLERGKIYYNYLKYFFGGAIENIHAQAILPGIGHSSTDVFASNCGKFYLFDSGGCNHVTSVRVAQKATIPDEFVLRQNYPNPFNPATTIEFHVPFTSSVSLSIFNLLGQKIKLLLKGAYEPGNYKIEWNGRDQRGKKVGSGLYFYRVLVEDGHGAFMQMKKMILLR